MWVKYLFTFVDLFLGILTCYVCTRTDLIKEKMLLLEVQLCQYHF